MSNFHQDDEKSIMYTSSSSLSHALCEKIEITTSFGKRRNENEEDRQEEEKEDDEEL